MADKDDIREGKDFGVGIPQQNRAFHVKGNGALDWFDINETAPAGVTVDGGAGFDFVNVNGDGAGSGSGRASKS